MSTLSRAFRRAVLTLSISALFLGLSFTGGGQAQAPPTPSPVADKARAVITLTDGRAVPTEWPLGIPLVLSAENSTAGNLAESIGWEIEPSYLTPWLATLKDGRYLVVGTGVKPVTMTVSLTVAKGDTFHRVQHRISATRGPDDPIPQPGPQPGPTPNPTPDPTPAPTPTPAPEKESGKLYVTLLWDSSKPEANATEARTRQSVRDGVRALNAEWTTLDFATAVGKSFVDRLKPTPTPPVILITRDNGALIKFVPLPSKPEDIVALVKGLRP